MDTISKQTRAGNQMQQEITPPPPPSSHRCECELDTRPRLLHSASKKSSSLPKYDTQAQLLQIKTYMARRCCKSDGSVDESTVFGGSSGKGRGYSENCSSSCFRNATNSLNLQDESEQQKIVKIQRIA